MDSLATIIYQLTVLTFAGLVIWAAVCDARTFTIPNRISLAIILLYPASVFAAPRPVDWQGALMFAGIILVVGYVMFLVHWRGAPLMGAGDTKLLTAVALWAGPALVLDLVVVMALFGGLIAISAWARNIAQMGSATAPSAGLRSVLSYLRIPHVHLPYGLAICGGALYVALGLFIGVEA